MDEASELREVSTPQPEKRKPFYRKWGTMAAEKIEKFLLPDYMKQIWQKNVRLWENQGQPGFDEAVNTWVNEIREGDQTGNPGLQTLRGDLETKPHVSIVIPAHNEERYILQLLQSLSEQHYDKGVEVIVVDNNSSQTDRTAAFAKQAGARVVQYTVPNDSPDRQVSQTALARQRGLEAALGDIVITTDSDAITPHGWITALTTPLDDDPTIATVTGANVHYDRPEHYLVYGKDKTSHILRRVQMAYLNKKRSSKTGRSPTYGANMAFRRSDALNIQGYDLNKYPGEDSDLGARLLPFGKILYVNNPETRVRVSPRRFEGMGRKGIFKAFVDYRGIYKSRDSGNADIVKR